MITVWFTGPRDAISSSAPGGAEADLRRARRAFIRPIAGIFRDPRGHSRRMSLVERLFLRSAAVDLKPATRPGIRDALSGAAR